MAGEYTFWKYKWAYSNDDPAVTFVAVPNRGYYSGYSATGAYRGAYLKAEPAATAAMPATAPAAPEPVNQKFAGWGRVIPISMGMRRMSPQIIWLRDAVSIGVTMEADFACSWGYNADEVPSETVVTALYADATKIWTLEDGNLLPGNWDWTFYSGTETQGKDPVMVAANGTDNTPAYRGQMYGVFTDFPLSKFGNKLPGISAEIMGTGGETPRKDSWNPADKQTQVVVETPFTITKGTYDGVTIGTANSGIRSRTYHKRGQYYLEFTVDHYDTAWRPRMIFKDWTGTGVGFSLATSNLTVPAGRSGGSIGAAMPMVGPINRFDLSAYPVGTDLDTTPWGEGDTVGLHINMTEGYVRGRIVSHGGAWSERVYYVSPAPGSIQISSGIEIGDPLYVHGCVSVPTYAGVGATADKQTTNFGAKPFLGAIPAGATAWNGTGGAQELIGELPLRDFISKVATYCELNPLTDLDFVGITDKIHGGIITRDTTFSDFLTVLGRAYGFDFYEGEVIRIVKRVVGSTYVIDKIIPPEDLIVETDRSIATNRRKDDSPTQLELSYIDVTQQFRWNIQRARRVLFPVKTTTSKRKDAFAIPIITTANTALTLAGRALYREAAQNVDHNASMLPRHMAVEPSDILTITAGDTEYTVKVTEVSMQADCRLTLSAVNLLTDEDMTFNADAGSPNLPYAGNTAKLEAEDGADRMQFSQFVSNLWSMEGEDIFVGRLVTLALAATDRPDTFVGAQFVSVMAATDRPDGFAASDAVLVDPTLALDLDFTTMG